jgi:Domain of unknown function (DUF4943)
MKLSIKLIALTLVFGLIGCEKQKDKIDVETYINQLKSGSYESFELPAFESYQIPVLLEYANDTTIITNFPRNGISSLWAPECTLGMYVLWTVESIRAVEIKTEHLIGRFPSQNPILALRNSTEIKLVTDKLSQIEAAKAYHDWWYTNIWQDVTLTIDPLENTKYKWH